MVHKSLRAPVLVAVCLVVLASVVPAYASPTLTTTLAQTGIKHATLGGYGGLLVNYTDPSSSSFLGFVYLDLVNSAGQTVFVNIASCSFASSKPVSCFITFSSAIPAGTYTAKVFATTNSSVPVSTEGSIQLSL